MNLSSPVQTADTAQRPAGRISLKRELGLTLGALGVVFGDIGTSPLYAMRETAQAAGGALPGQAAVYGSVSLRKAFGVRRAPVYPAALIQFLKMLNLFRHAGDV